MASFYEDGRGWRFNFKLFGHRYRGRARRTKKQSMADEQALRDRILDAAAGHVPTSPTTGPSFTDWAGVTYTYAVEREKLSDLATLDRNLKKMLLFWGAAPVDPAKVVDGAPYHDLTLDAPIRDGGWLLKFEEWMAGRGIAGSTKNHYRSAASKLYRVAMLAQYRTQTGITQNPFRGILRDRPVTRTTMFTKPQLRLVMRHAHEPWLVLAIRIAALAPELRLGSIARLTWAEVAADYRWITIAEHKTARRTGAPAVTPIVPMLRSYLKAARRRQPKGCATVLEQDGQPVKVKAIQQALARAVTAAGMTYGMGLGEVTFHTLRHTAGTLMAEIGLPDRQRQQAIGHGSAVTTAGYTHLRPLHKIRPLTRLAKHIGPALEAATSARRKARSSGAVTPRVTPQKSARKRQSEATTVRNQQKQARKR